jgi:outer membrane immunogenic protein
MRKVTVALFGAAALCLTVPAHAGVYLGGGIGSATIEDDEGTPFGDDFDEADGGYKLFGGYRFDWLPIVSIAGEIGYRDAGQQDSELREYELSGFDYGVLAGVGLGPVELFARVGRLEYDLEKAVSGIPMEFDGTANVYGAGARFSILGLGLRAEYEKLDVDELDDVDMYSLSAFFEF